MEIMNLKRQEQSSVDAAQSPSFARHVLPTSDSPLQSNDDIPNQNNIEVGSIYEIDHAHLPTRTPVQLRSIRVVIVSEKTEKNVSVIYPRLECLGKYFSSRMSEVFPSLEEKFTMGTKLASKVLYREVSSQEFAEKVHLEGFWLVKSVSVGGLGDVIISKKDTILTSELKCNGMLRWGVRRQVKFLGKHREIINNPRSSSSFVTGGGKVKWEGDQKQEDNDDDDEKEEEREKGAKGEGDEEEEKKGEDEEDDDEDVAEETNKNLKRKRYSFRSDEKAKKTKHSKRRTYNTKSKNKCKQLVLKNPIERWSAERYKSAEKNLLEVMKAKGAVFGKPILRPALRAEARKRIGDTGLLDHLLKHMAGKVAPGGNERFRRRHNADGAMEYWLESADLVSIRKDAGVQDPYWTPPPGWKPGDCPTQDPLCAKELKFLKDETSNIRRDMEEMVSKKQFEEEVARLRREMEELVSMKKQQESQAIEVSNGGAMCEMLNLDHTNSLILVPSESNLNTPALVTQLEKYKKQLMDISDFVRGMEEEMGRLTSKVGENTKAEGKGAGTGSELIVAEKEKTKQKEEKRKAVAAAEPPPVAGAEEKAEKIKRLKSGFRICKPQGTFLWPNMANSTCTGNNNNMLSPQVVVQVEDLFMVPTPTSVSSSTASAPPHLPYHHHYHHPASPVKPLAERRAVTVTVSTVSKAPRPYEGGENNHSTTTTTTNFNNNATTAMINLNDTPVSPREGRGCRVTPSSARAAANSPSSSASCLSNGGGVETWLALATPNPATSGDTSRG